MKNSPVSILYITAYGSAQGGGERYLLELIRSLDRSRFRPLVVLPQQGNLVEKLEALGAEAFVIGASYGGHGSAEVWFKRLAETRQQVFELAALLRAKDVRLVHTNCNTRLEGALAARIVGVHHVYLAHIARGDEGFYRWLKLDQASFASLMGSLSHAIVAVSGSVASTLSPPLPASKVRVAHNGIDFESFDAAARAGSADLRQTLGLPAGSVVVMAVGRIDRQKGFDVLVEAAVRVAKAEPRAHFVVVGADTDKQLARDLRARIDAAGLTGHVHFLGFRQDVPSLLRQADIFALTSRIEGHPYVLLEALASGCAVVASRCAGVEETVVDGETALLTDVGDVDATAAAIARLVRDQALRQSLGGAGSSHVRQHFTLQRSVAAITAVYEEALASDPPAAGAPLIDLFLDTANDLGNLGLRVAELSRRVEKLEAQPRSALRESLSRVARRLKGG
jgi:glycosyltransferase involved in cell wall biosynthesis